MKNKPLAYFTQTNITQKQLTVCVTQQMSKNRENHSPDAWLLLSESVSPELGV